MREIRQILALVNASPRSERRSGLSQLSAAMLRVA